MDRVRSGAAQLAWTSTGPEGADSAALLLHAGVTDQRSWRPLRDAVGDRHRLVAYDRRGFGETTYEPELHSEVDDALAVLDAADLASVVLVGASNGGQHAVDLALAHPERVRALVLIGSGVRGGPDEDVDTFEPPVRALYEAYEAAEGAGDPDELNRIEAHAWLDGWAADEGRVTGPVRDLFLDMNGRALRAVDAGPEVPLPDAWDQLHQIGVPALVLCGELDVLCLPASQHLAREIHGAALEILGGTGHLPHLEAHARCLDRIVEFLQRQSTA